MRCRPHTVHHAALASLALILLTTRLAPPASAESTSASAPAEVALVAPRVEVATTTTVYAVTGSTLQDIVTSLHAEAGSEWAASTTWQFSTSYTYDTTSGPCQARSANVNATITYRLPDWHPSPDAPAELASDWATYIEAVRVHEAGHRAIAVAAAVDIAEMLQALPAQPTCVAFEQSARDATTARTSQQDRDQVSYDEQTRHGLTQGAIFR
ncbi:MAG: hypothetical protein NVSMB2_07490 [Chloroflexota bacterium]